MIKKDQVEGAFLGDYPIGQGQSEGMEAEEEPMTTLKLKWDQTLLASICVVLEKFGDAFPQGLPLGFPLVCQGH